MPSGTGDATMIVKTAKADDPAIDQLCINTIRTLSMDAVQQANSGHPGTPMAMAPVVYCLWQQFLRFDPDDPIWPNRDRFVLSARSRIHASALDAPFVPVQACQSRIRNIRPPQRHARRPKKLPPTEQQVPWPPGIPLDLRCRNHNW